MSVTVSRFLVVLDPGHLVAEMLAPARRRWGLSSAMQKAEGGRRSDRGPRRKDDRATCSANGGFQSQWCSSCDVGPEGSFGAIDLGAGACIDRCKHLPIVVGHRTVCLASAYGCLSSSENDRPRRGAPDEAHTAGMASTLVLTSAGHRRTTRVPVLPAGFGRADGCFHIGFSLP